MKNSFARIRVHNHFVCEFLRFLILANMGSPWPSVALKKGAAIGSGHRFATRILSTCGEPVPLIELKGKEIEPLAQQCVRWDA